MTFEHHAQTRMGHQSDYELQRFTNGFGINDPAINASPLSDQQLQQMAEDELFFREQMQADPAQFEADDPLEDL